VRTVVAESEQLAGRSVTVDAPSVTVSVDRPKVERIVENLVANMARHTAPGVPVWVRVRGKEGGVLISVEDAGPGVPPQFRSVIFEPFQQGPGVPEPRPGVGIGLSLVARFAELHGGHAWVEERPGGGSSFKVFLPSEKQGPPGA
jgi:signal transduction histidine kinase